MASKTSACEPASNSIAEFSASARAARVLFLGQGEIVNYPWYPDFLKAAEGVLEVTLLDPDKDLSAQFEDKDVIVELGGGVGTPEMVELARRAKVRLWQVIGTGVDHVDVKSIRAAGIRLTNTPGQFSAIALAELAMCLMLYLVKQLPEAGHKLRQRVLYKPLGEELDRKTLGLIGFGSSAQELARRAAAFNMKIHAIDAHPIDRELLARHRVEWFGGVDRFDTILREADIISIHVPLTEQTRGMFDARAFEMMKNSAYLINIARGPIVDQAALVNALQNGLIAGAGLDVFEEEPIDPQHPLLAMDNVICTPHVAGCTLGVSRRRAEVAVDNILRVMRGEEPNFKIEAN